MWAVNLLGTRARPSTKEPPKSSREEKIPKQLFVYVYKGQRRDSPWQPKR
jgi:hypothetical protein